MFSPELWFHDEEHGRAIGVLSRLVGQKLIGVRYAIAEGDFWPHGHRHDDLHEVDMGMEVTVESGIRFVVSWAMDGLVQGLGQQVLPGDSEQDVGTTVDVSAKDQWKPLLRVPIERIGLASHATKDGYPPTYWSMRIEFSNGENVVIALGEVDDELEYQPESLAVLFDEEAARSYHIATSAMSA